LRVGIENLIEMLSALPVDLTLTTNASALPKKAQALKDAGLKRITVSLDSLDDAIFKSMDDVDSAAEIVGMLDKEFGVEPVDPLYRGEVAKRWQYKDGSGEIGVIAS